MNTWKLRDDQKEAYVTASGCSRLIVNMPTGWGKSLLLNALAAADTNNNPNRKIVVCVPQRIIANGFASLKEIELPDGRIVKWAVGKNLCLHTESKVKALVAFFRKPAASSLQGRVVLTTHMTISYALAQLSDEEISIAAEDLTLILDESHHLLASTDCVNRMGKQVLRFLKCNPATFKLWLATAYFFRGDHLPIIHESYLAEFTRVHIPFDKYWENLKYIKTYSYDFITYKGTLFKELECVVKDNIAPTIVYCPQERHKMLLGKSKSDFARTVERILCLAFNADKWSTFESAVRSKAVVIDLTKTAERNEKVKFINEYGEKVAAIITVGMFREGADWPQASKIIDLVPTNSDQDRLQRFGRLVRDHESKTHISYYSFFQYVIEQGEEERRLALSKLYAHFHASLVLENAIHPIRKKFKPGNAKPRTDTVVLDSVSDPLGQLSQNLQQKLFKETYETLIELQGEKDETNSVISPEEAQTAVSEVLASNATPGDHTVLAKQILLCMRRMANIAIKANDLIDAGFDKIWSTEIFAPFIAYSAGVGGPSTLAEIRRVIDNVFDKRWSDFYEEIKVLPGPPLTSDRAYWWCTHNRTQRQKGNLAEKRIRLLDQIEWWTWTTGNTDRWDNMYQVLKDRPKPPKAGTVEYSWVRQQRRLYQEGKLDQAKIDSLQSIPGWKWASLNTNWESQFLELSQLAEAPQRGSTLYEWMRTQRKLFGKRLIDEARAKKLEGIAWWTWKQRRSNRDDGLELLKTCIQQAVKRGESKQQLSKDWAHVAGVKADQVHKYLRRSTEEVRRLYDSLQDFRGSNLKKLANIEQADVAEVRPFEFYQEALTAILEDNADLGYKTKQKEVEEIFGIYKPPKSIAFNQVLASLPDEIRAIYDALPGDTAA